MANDLTSANYSSDRHKAHLPKITPSYCEGSHSSALMRPCIMFFVSYDSKNILTSVT